MFSQRYLKPNLFGVRENPFKRFHAISGCVSGFCEVSGGKGLAKSNAQNLPMLLFLEQDKIAYDSLILNETNFGGMIKTVVGFPCMRYLESL